MIGILIVTHSRLGEALIEAAELIVGSRPEAAAAVSIDLTQNVDRLRQKIADGLRQIRANEGTLILTDMFGGTPSNLSYSFLEEGRVEVISGVNLPMVIKALNARGKKPLPELAVELEAYGKKSISLASGILKGNKRGA
jgi:PTS system mannose-specific IIA component